MTEDEIAALVFGPFAMIFGACFIAAREPISKAARSQRARAGRPIGTRVQSPARIAFGGAFFIVVGAALIVGAITGRLS